MMKEVAHHALPLFYWLLFYAHFAANVCPLETNTPRLTGMAWLNIDQARQSFIHLFILCDILADFSVIASFCVLTFTSITRVTETASRNNDRLPSRRSKEFTCER